MEKELRKLGRRELVDVIYQMKKNEERLQEEIAALQEALEEKRIRISEAGSIAAAAADITKIFSSAQETADMYLSEIERGVKTPSLRLFIKIIEALDVSADFILRDELPSGKNFVYDEITSKLEGLTPKQRKAIADLIDAYVKNL